MPGLAIERWRRPVLDGEAGCVAIKAWSANQIWRVEQDSNLRTGVNRHPGFQPGALDHSAIDPGISMSMARLGVLPQLAADALRLTKS